VRIDSISRRAHAQEAREARHAPGTEGDIAVGHLTAERWRIEPFGVAEATAQAEAQAAYDAANPQ